jgi:hypothetical protein
MAPHAPNTSVLGGLSSVNGSTFWHILRDACGMSLCSGKRSVLGCIYPEVRNGEQVTASLKGKNGRGHNFLSF